MRQNCFVVPVSHYENQFSPLTLAPYRLGLSAEAVAAECATAADIESKLEELEDMYQVRQNRGKCWCLLLLSARGIPRECLTRARSQDFADEIGADKEDLFDDNDGFSVWTCSTGGSSCADACQNSVCSPGER